MAVYGRYSLFIASENSDTVNPQSRYSQLSNTGMAYSLNLTLTLTLTHKWYARNGR